MEEKGNGHKGTRTRRRTDDNDFAHLRVENSSRDRRYSSEMCVDTTLTSVANPSHTEVSVVPLSSRYEMLLTFLQIPVPNQSQPSTTHVQRGIPKLAKRDIGTYKLSHHFIVVMFPNHMCATSWLCKVTTRFCTATPAFAGSRQNMFVRPVIRPQFSIAPASKSFA